MRRVFNAEQPLLLLLLLLLLLQPSCRLITYINGKLISDVPVMLNNPLQTTVSYLRPRLPANSIVSFKRVRLT
jgi:hypothetical protein